METIIKKAIEGGYMPERAVEFSGANNGIIEEGGKLTIRGWSVWNMENGSSFCLNHSEAVCDPLFWQALGKAMGWQKWHDHEWDDNEIVGFSEEKYHGIRFHEINLTDGWDKAIEYLTSLLPEVK